MSIVGPRTSLNFFNFGRSAAQTGISALLRPQSRFAFTTLKPQTVKWITHGKPHSIALAPIQCSSFPFAGRNSLQSNKGFNVHLNMSSRNFHYSTPKGIINPRNFGEKQPRLQIYKISPIFIFLSGLGFFVLLFALLPFIFTTFFPIIILAIVVYQFNRWRRNAFNKQLLRALRSSSLHTKMGTINSLRVGKIEERLKMNSGNHDLLQTILNNSLSDASSFSNSFNSLQEVKRLQQFVKNRVLEAIETDENGIRNFFLGNDVKTWLDQNYDILIATDEYASFSRGHHGSIISQIKFPLYLKSSKNPKKHLADVIVASLAVRKNNAEQSNYFMFLGDMPAPDTDCPMVIAVQSVGLLASRQFLITTPGKSGEWQSKYDISTTTDGFNEYTVRNKGSI